MKKFNLNLSLKLNIAINSTMVATMIIFLLLAYYNQKRTLLRDSSRHLEELLNIMPSKFDVGKVAEEKIRNEIVELENRISKHIGYRHKIIITNERFNILFWNGENLGKKKFYSSFIPSSNFGRRNNYLVESSEGSKWIVGRKGVELFRKDSIESNGFMYLLESYEFIEENLNTFWKIHGLHVAVTFMTFIVLINFITSKYIRKPINELLEAIRKIELGIWNVTPKIKTKDEFSWLKEKFSEMGKKLENTVMQLVKAEKLASKILTSRKIFKEIEPSLNKIKVNLIYLKNLEENYGGYEVLENIDNDLEKIRGKIYILENQ